MSGLIPQNCLDEILNRIDIVELISSYIPLKKAGRNFKANCPFHHEKTPSFMVSPDRQIYRCFGCGEAGNAFKFLMRYERLEFPEAVEILAKKAGVILPKSTAQDTKTASLTLKLFQINEMTRSFYAAVLRSPMGKQASSYLLGRGLTKETIDAFKIGFAPDSWDALIRFTRSKGISIGLLEKAGLVLAREGGGYYDRFRKRIIFPILDIKERVLGFGARVLDDSLPKYMNSPETPIYTKGRHVFGLWAAKDAIRENDKVVIVEGYLDCIIPYQYGLHNIVASLGTALTVEQARLLKRFTHNVVVVFDPDKAGELATLRSLEIFIEEGMEIKVVSLPSGFDPDSYVRHYGLDSFTKKISEAEDFFAYKLKVLKNRFSVKEATGKSKIAAEMLFSINRIKGAVLRSEYIKRLAEELGVKEEALVMELKGIKNDARESFISTLGQQKINISPTEKVLLRLILSDPTLISKAKEALSSADFQSEIAFRIASYLFQASERKEVIQPRNLLNYFNDESASLLICECAFSNDEELQDKERILEDCIRRLKLQRIRTQRQLLQEKIKAAQNSGDEELVRSLMQKFNDLIKTQEVLVA